MRRTSNKRRQWKMPDGSTVEAVPVSSWTHWERYTLDAAGYATRMVRAQSRRELDQRWDAGENLVR